MIIQNISQKKGIVCFLVFAFILLINTEFLTSRVSYNTENRGESIVHTLGLDETVSSQQDEQFENVMNEGKRLMQEEFDYEGAIKKFNEALTYAVATQQKSDVYFYLSLAYYATLHTMGEQVFENTVHMLIQVDYHRTLDREICPSKYIERFQEIKKEYGTLQVRSNPGRADVFLGGEAQSVGKTPLIVGVIAGETRITLKHGSETMEDMIAVSAGAEILSPIYTFPSLVAAEVELPEVAEKKPDVVKRKPEVAVQEGVKKEGGNKSMLYIIGGLVVAGGAAAALLLGGGGEDDSVSTGSIQVNSNPTGADVHLDGQNTGRTTNTTLTNVSPGSHRVEVLKDGYGDYETNISVTKGQTATVNATLSAHTINVTQPTETANWTPGEEVTIRWTTGGGSSQMGFMNAPGGIGSAAHIRRMSRMRATRSNATARDSRERNTRRGNSAGSQESDSLSQGTSATNETPADQAGGSDQGTLNTPRNSSLGRINLLGSSQGTSPNNTVKPQSLNHVMIELYRGGNLEKTIIDDTDNTGRYDWKVSSSIPDASNYKIRVSAAGDSSVRGESPKFMIAKLGKLQVKSKPKGATIWVDGESMGVTDQTIKIKAGDHELRLALDRFQDWEEDVKIKANEKTTVEAILELDSFKENFNDGKADHFRSYSDYGIWSVKDGQYQVTGAHKQTVRVLYDLGKFGDEWTYEAKVKSVSGSTSYINLVFGVDDKFDEYCRFGIYPTYQRRYAYWANYTVYWEDRYLLYYETSKNINKDGWNTLKIVSNGRTISFYINGKLEGSKKINKTPTSGRIGFSTYLYSKHNIVAFDDVKVTVGDTTGSTTEKSVH